MVPVGVDRDEVARWLAASCEAQGVPVRIVDPLIVRNVVTLLDGRARERSSRPVPQPPCVSVRTVGSIAALPYRTCADAQTAMLMWRTLRAWTN